MNGIRLFKVPTHGDERGPLSVIEFKDQIDFEIKRFYYVTNVMLDRGGHCMKGEKKIYVMLQGSCKARFFAGKNWEEYEIQGPKDAIVMKGDYWREFVSFSEGAVLAALSNLNYDENLYIRDINKYEKYIKSLEK